MAGYLKGEVYIYIHNIYIYIIYIYIIYIYIHIYIYTPRTQTGPLFLIEVRALFWRVDLQKWRCFLRCFLWMGWKDVTPKSLSG